MVLIETIRAAISPVELNADNVIAYLDEDAKPIAEEKSVLEIASGAVYVCHRQGRRLQSALMKPRNANSLAYTISKSFNTFTDMYIAIKGVRGRSGSDENILLGKELDFIYKLIDLNIRLYNEIGEPKRPGHVPVALAEESRLSYRDEINNLINANITPLYAAKSNMVRSTGASVASAIGTLLIVLWYMYNAGFLDLIYDQFLDWIK